MFRKSMLSLPPNTSYEDAIRHRNLAVSIHQPCGRVIIIGEDIYYSPNSSFTPPAPPPANISLLRHPVKDDVTEFHQPRWWSSESAYLPFFPISPNFYAPPFHSLFHRPFNHQKHCVQMDSTDILQWNDLEHCLKLSVANFQSRYAIPLSQMTPIIPTSLVCQEVFEDARMFYTAEKNCRSWFAVWMAMISFCIAIAQTVDGEDDPSLCPTWFRCLTRHIDEQTASGIRQQLSQFTPDYPRAGVFLDLCQIGHTTYPTVEFFEKFGISVWYPWDHREESLGLKHYAPPSHLLQQAKGFMTKEPSHTNNDRPWEAFFAERKKREMKAGPMPRQEPTLKVFLWETDIDGQWVRTAVRRRDIQETLAEDDRYRKVFDERSNEWDCIQEIGQLDPGKVQAVRSDDGEPRSLVGNNSTSSVQAEISRARLVSTPPSVHASWDDDDNEPLSSIEVSSIRPEAFRQHLLPTAPSVSHLPIGKHSSVRSEPSRHRIPSSTASSVPIEGAGSCTNAISPSQSLSKVASTLPLVPTSSSSRQAPQNVDATKNYTFTEPGSPGDILKLFYGFVPPPPGFQLRLPTYSVGGREVSNLLKGVGAPVIPDRYIESTVGQAAINFFWSISQKEYVPPSNAIYDLAHSNSHCIKKSRRLSFMRKFSADVTAFIFKDLSTVEWSIGVTNILDAMFILRLDPDINDYQIACELLNRGVRFMTLLRLPSFIPQEVPQSIPRIRLSGYKFTAGDYQSYCLEREQLLRNPRIGRCALKHGGILWRLAMDSVSFHSVLSGPTAAVELRHQCKALNIGDNYLWCDDSLHETEMDILCGVYYVYTGQGPQRATMSWWPPAQLWDSIIHYTFWTAMLEDWYQDRLQEIESGTAVPLTSSQWRSKIKASSSVRRAFDHSTKSAVAFLNSLPTRF